jgi:ABC-type molybdenum transport system ATPase subunit/photorepair protein PhrA
MPPLTITVTSPVLDTGRVLQCRGLFDLPEEKASTLTWTVELPLSERPWHIGLITGPSGSGKSTIARRLWPDATAFPASLHWPTDRSVLDAFPAPMPVKEVVQLLSSVGFSSPPAWLRPYHVLSTGQQFRTLMARLLAESLPLTVVDEFTSTVDRTVAQVGSHALARTIRQRRQRFVAVTCHEDVIDWLQPDWLYYPADNSFQWRCLQRRPPISLSIVRCHPSAWPLFAPHHYLSGDLNPMATCFLAFWRDSPVAFSSWLNFFGQGPPARREHRTVVLPDFQGVGIGMALSSLIASMWKALGLRALSTTTHPAFTSARRRSPHWRMHRAPSLAGSSASKERRMKHATTRLTAGFEYVGPPMDPCQARLLLATA